MQTLIPQPVAATARPFGRWGRVFAFGLTPKALWLLVAGFLFSIPEFFHPHRLWMMFAWDAAVLLLTLLDALQLPAPERLTIERRIPHAPALGEKMQVELTVLHDAPRILTVFLTDPLNPSILPLPRPRKCIAYPRDPARVEFSSYPGTRGDVELGSVSVRYRWGMQLAERWAVCDLRQTIRVAPSTGEEEGGKNLFILRARQIEQQMRRVRLAGMGREFERMRSYRPGDEIRNISWTATARTGKVITREFTAERSQQVWIMIDAGRLSRTAFDLRRNGISTSELNATNPFNPALFNQQEIEDDASLLTVTQLDMATTTAVMLARVVNATGDKCGLLVYGRKPQQQLTPGAGAAHLRLMVDLLSQARSEPSESNPMIAAARLKQLQPRRGMVLWITELADIFGQPEIALAAANLARRHLVVLVLLQHAEINRLADKQPASITEMYAITAANEQLERRQAVVSRLRHQGVMVVETTADQAGIAAINQYLEVKARGTL
jgi:uncharacterized protein (DUF58 family)